MNRRRDRKAVVKPDATTGHQPERQGAKAALTIFLPSRGINKK